jgi:hypothetical protein
MSFLRLGVAAVVLATSLAATPIGGLVSTGVSLIGNQDANWQVQPPGAATPQAAFATDDAGFPFNPYWSPNDAQSRWISPQAGYFSPYPGHTDVSGGVYVFSASFNLASPQAWFTMRMLADNQVTDVKLNGTSLGIQYRTDCVECMESMQVWSDVILVNNGFQSGMNTLEFAVFNGIQDTWNPAGLRVEFLDSSQAPEPSTIAMLALGGGLLGVGAWRRRRTQ